MLGYVPFPPIDKTPYAITLGPYAFLWLELQSPALANSELSAQELTPQEVTIPATDIDGVLAGVGAQLLQEAFLPRYMAAQRWFGAKSRHIQSIGIADSIVLASSNGALLVLDVQYTDGPPDTYTLPLAVRPADTEYPKDSVIARLQQPGYDGVLLDGLALPEIRDLILSSIATGVQQQTRQGGIVQGLSSAAFAPIRGAGDLPSRRGSAEQSNSSLLYGDRLILKLFRRLQPGENPDAEIGRFLTDVAHFPHIAPFAGEVVYTPKDGEATTVALLQGLVANEGDGWSWTLGQIDRLKNGDNTGYLQNARLLGQRTGEMHRGLATPTDDPAFAAEPTTAAALNADADRLESQIAAALQAVRTRIATLPEDLLTPAATLIARRDHLHAVALRLRNLPPAQAGIRIRIHGDYHLGQVLRTANDFVLLDFEGEPARSLAERRAKQSPLRDVAGMLRSFSYAGVAGYGSTAEHASARQAWERDACDAFLDGYREAFAADPSVAGHASIAQEQMAAYLLEKALYELMYELNNRPDWVALPLFGILDLLETTGRSQQ